MEEDEENLVQEEISGESANPNPSFLMVQKAEIPLKNQFLSLQPAHDNEMKMSLFVGKHYFCKIGIHCMNRRGAVIFLCC